MPHVSIIVPAFNSENTLERCLKAIRESSYKDYEVIVVDDGSSDATHVIAEKYADKVIRLCDNSGRAYARSMGMKHAQGAIIVNIDSDVLIKHNSLSLINDYLSLHEDADAVTGLLSKECPFTNFSSQYKNLYMNYTFQRLPEKVTFLSGAIYAIRSRVAEMADFDHKYGVDTAFGQKLFSRGKKISFLKELEVVHLNKNDFFALLKRNFLVSFYLAKIFLKYKGWKQLGRYNTGYVHAARGQIANVAIAPMIIVSSACALFHHFLIPLTLLFVFTWCFLNLRFFVFLKKERGYFFAGLSMCTIFLENVIMALGIASGFTLFSISHLAKVRKNST